MNFRKTSTTSAKVVLLISSIGLITNWCPTHLLMSGINYVSTSISSVASPLRYMILTVKFTILGYELQNLHDSLCLKKYLTQSVHLSHYTNH
jgi:hypothetical protein